MEKISKEALRRYKKARLARARSSSESSSSDSETGSSSSYSSSNSERHRRKKAVSSTSRRRSSSSSGEERRRREKYAQRSEYEQRKLEAKRNHIKRKLKAKLKKRAALAEALHHGTHSHRALSPTSQAKLKKLAERKHERERTKHRTREREHHRSSRSPNKITKIRIHQEVKRQKSPPRVHHQLMSREKIIIQTRTRSQTPSAERERERQKLRHEEVLRERERRERERERAEREALRDKERADALARCQERQRERERVAKEKIRREEEEKKYERSGGGGDRLLPRQADRELAIAAARGYESRERSMDSEGRGRVLNKREVDPYEREREYIGSEHREHFEREDIRREREYVAPSTTTRRREVSPETYASRDTREIYEEDRKRVAYERGTYVEEGRHPRERDNYYYPPDRAEWKGDWPAETASRPEERNWDDGDNSSNVRGGFIGGAKRGGSAGTGTHIHPKLQHQDRRIPEQEWEPEDNREPKMKKPEYATREVHGFGGVSSTQPREPTWMEHDQRGEKPIRPDHVDRRWQHMRREDHEEGGPVGIMQRIGGIQDTTISGSPQMGPGPMHHMRGMGRGGFRRGGGMGMDFRGHHPQGMMNMQGHAPGGMYHGPGSVPRFPMKRGMLYVNPGMKSRMAGFGALPAATAVLQAAKAAAQSAANATTNPSILGSISARQQPMQSSSSAPIIILDKPEAGEILPEHEAGTGDAREEAKTENPTEVVKPAYENPFKKNTEVVRDSPIVTAELSVAGGVEELSEISDSDDDILIKGDRKSKSEAEEVICMSDNKIETANEGVKGEEAVDTESIDVVEKIAKPVGIEDEEMLDFEEISDGELEEETRHKGVGDALGVDWASLIAETKLEAETAAQCSVEQSTTAKQRWQPHRIILDIGVSLNMAGEEYAKEILEKAQEKLKEEINEEQIKIKKEIKDDLSSAADEDSQNTVTAASITDTEATNLSELTQSADKKPDLEELEKSIKTEVKDDVEDNATGTINATASIAAAFSADKLHPLACVQIGQRARFLEQQQLFTNICGSHSRALSTQHDFKLRRQLNGVPGRDCVFQSPLSRLKDKLSTIALDAFKRTLEVK